jgi:hypothetical protein
LKTIHTLLVNVPHNQYYFRVLIGKENSQWVPAVFVISRGESNPLHYCDSVYHLLIVTIVFTEHTAKPP